MRLMIEESAPLSLEQRQFVIRRIEDEVHGPRARSSRCSRTRPSPTSWSTAHSQVYVERRGKLELTDVQLQRRRAPDADHRPHRLGGRPAHRRVVADGRRAPAGRLARQRDHPAAGARRADAVDPPLRASNRCTVDDLVRLGTIDRADGQRAAGRRARRGSTSLISGGTGSGKTTLLNILSGFIPDDERIVTIEDAAELQLQQPHVVRLETRPPNIEGKGEVTQRDLVRNSLRMRPDRIIVGEVRGAEALDMLQAMNTGHDGSLTTIHANTAARRALSRIENDGGDDRHQLPDAGRCARRSPRPSTS